MKLRAIIQSVLVILLLCFNSGVSIAATNVSLVLNSSNNVVGRSVIATGVADASLIINSTTSSAAVSQTPQWPAGATVTISRSQTQATLTWPAATDNIGVAGYEIERDNAELGTVDGNTTTFTDTSLQQGNNTYVWSVLAFDKAGNWSTIITGQISDNSSLTGAYLTSIDNNVSSTGASVSGSGSVPLNPTIKLCFSHNVVDDAVFSNNQQNITMQTVIGMNVPVNVSRIDPTVNFNERQNLFVAPVSPLASGTTYKIIIGSGLTAKNGLLMGTSQVVEFSTAGSGSGAPSLIIYQDATGHYVSVNYLEALSNAQMKTALAKALSSAELANLPIFVVADNGNIINYTAAIAKNETYVQALTDTAVNQATAPTATSQMNGDGSVTSLGTIN